MQTPHKTLQVIVQERLEHYADEAENDPQINSVKRVAFDLSEALQSNELSIEEFESLLVETNEEHYDWSRCVSFNYVNFEKELNTLRNKGFDISIIKNHDSFHYPLNIAIKQFTKTITLEITYNPLLICKHKIEIFKESFMFEFNTKH